MSPESNRKPCWKNWPNFFGFQLEKFILDWLQWQCLENPAKFPFDTVGKYWDRGQNEIDVVPYQENGHVCMIGECKLNSKRVTDASLEGFDQQAEVISRKRRFKQIQKVVFVGDVASENLNTSLKKKDTEIFDVSDYFY